MSRLKVGAVSYLNTKPLVFGLQESGLPIDLTFDLPSRLADRLGAGELDAGLIPVVEAITNPLYTIVSDACIACRGPVGSVKLFCRVPVDAIRTLALDEGSRTSVILAKVLLQQRFSISPICETLMISQPWEESTADAVLVIGDRAMSHLACCSSRNPNGGRSFEFCHELDLGDLWYCWTLLPFVFAVWAARPNVDLLMLDTALTEARDRGLQHLGEISSIESTCLGLPVEECRRYLTEHLHFHLGLPEKQGLELFFSHAKRQGLIDRNVNLQFYDCEITG